MEIVKRVWDYDLAAFGVVLFGTLVFFCVLYPLYNALVPAGTTLAGGVGTLAGGAAVGAYALFIWASPFILLWIVAGAFIKVFGNKGS